MGAGLGELLSNFFWVTVPSLSGDSRCQGKEDGSRVNPQSYLNFQILAGVPGMKP